MNVKKLLHAEQEFDENDLITSYHFTLMCIGFIKDSILSPSTHTQLLTHIGHLKMSTYKKLNFGQDSEIEFSEDEIAQMLAPKVTQVITPLSEEEISDIDDFNLDYADHATVCLGEAPKMLSSRELLEHSRIVALDDTLVYNDVGKPLLNAPKLVRNNAIKRQNTPLPGYDAELDDIDDGQGKGKKSRGPKVMRWCVTWNNPDVTGDELVERLAKSDKVKGYVFQYEKGESGTPHFQMYMEFNTQVYCTGVYETLGDRKVCATKALGSKKQNLKYCTKDEDRLGGPWLHGTCKEETGQGKRTDLDDMYAECRESGAITQEIREKYGGTAVRYGKNVQQALEAEAMMKAQKIDDDYWVEQLRLKKAGLPYGQKPRKLVLFFGPSAVGKTTEAKLKARDEYDEAPYMKQGTSHWWCWYNCQKVVIVDEWQMKMTGTMETFNDLTNYGLYRGETKGGQTGIIADAMYLTTNCHPMDIFKTKWKDPRYRALCRRFAEVQWWNDNKELVVLKNPGQEPVYMGDDPSEEWNLWNTENAAWVHFWKGRTVREGDHVIHHTDGTTSSNDVDSYFTW